MKRWLALLACIAVTAGLVVMWPSAPRAVADPIDCHLLGTCTIPGVPSGPNFGSSCKAAPTPASPGAGVPGVFDGSPSPGGPSRYTETWLGPRWSTYDLGCGGSLADPWAAVDTGIGNFFYGLAKDLIGFSNGLHRLIGSDLFKPFDKLETNVVTGLHDRIWTVFLPISLLILGLLVVARSHRQDMHGTLRTVGWALFVMLLVTFVFSYPTRAGRAADSIETSTVSAINGALSGDGNSGSSAAASLETDAILFPAFTQGELGTNAGPLAQQFGDKLWNAQSLTWQEAKDPKAAIAKKKQQFSDLATQIHDTDESAYVALKGQQGDRWGIGILALVGALLTVPFRILADLLVIASLLLIRVGVMFAPMLGVVGLHHRMSGLVKGTLTAIGAACINACVFSAGAAVNVYGISVLLSSNSGVPLWVGLLLCGILAFVLWFALKPFRRLTQMVGAGFSPIHQTASATRGSIQKVGGMVSDVAIQTVAVPAGRAIYNRLRYGGNADGEDGEESRPPRREALGDTEPLTPPATPTTEQNGDQRPATNGNGPTPRSESAANTWEDVDPLAPGAEPAPAQPERIEPVEVEETA